jgi:formate dehydrogenase subunit beta
MNQHWSILTHGDPIGSVHRFLLSVWQQAGLDGVLVGINGSVSTRPHLVQDRDQLVGVNPFKPLMTSNLARAVPEMLAEHSGERLGVLLRPCEMRALIEMGKHHPLDTDRLVTMCVDCLGTLPLDDFEWRTAAKESPDQLAEDALRFARQGGILAYHHRPACQMCARPGAESADVNVHVLGLPVRQEILVHAVQETAASRLNLAAMTDGPADPALVSQHQRILARLAERHQHTMDKVLLGLEEILPRNVDALVQQLEKCGACQQCMAVCPICSVDFPERSADGHYSRASMIRWMVSCAGCGMCEQSCREHLPLSAIFGSIRQALNNELGYTPGCSTQDVLPV